MTDPLESLAFPEHDLVAPSAPDSSTPDEMDSYWQWLNGRDGHE